MGSQRGILCHSISVTIVLAINTRITAAATYVSVTLAFTTPQTLNPKPQSLLSLLATARTGRRVAS